jgi:hypothetical protein
MDDQGVNREGSASVNKYWKPQFSLKGLLAMAAVLAIGIVSLSEVFADRTGKLGEPTTGILYFGGGALIGAGVFIPFNKPWFGAVLGVAANGIILYALVVGLR